MVKIIFYKMCGKIWIYLWGEVKNYSNIARDCGVDSKTVKEYYQILIDTLLAIRVEPFKKRQSRQVVTKASKYYLYLEKEKGEEFGKAFEHFILMELVAYKIYSEKRFEINFWRTKSGLEVDFILEKGKVAIEIKGTNRVDKNDFKGLIAFKKEYFPSKSIIVCNEKEKRIHNGIAIIPWKMFLKELWKGEIL